MILICRVSLLKILDINRIFLDTKFCILWYFLLLKITFISFYPSCYLLLYFLYHNITILVSIVFELSYNFFLILCTSLCFFYKGEVYIVVEKS